MQIIPAIELEAGRSRQVCWPAASTGRGGPTDRPEVIAARFVELGAPLIHLVDFDAARGAAPANLDTVGRVAARVATPLQLAGGLEGPDAIRLAFAAGATRVVLSLAMADDPAALRACLAVAGDWLAIGLDARPERLAAYPWRRRPAPASLDALVGDLAAAGVRRFVLGHGGSSPHAAGLGSLARQLDVEILVAGGVTDQASIGRLRDAGIHGVILGEALLSGRLDYPNLVAAAA